MGNKDRKKNDELPKMEELIKIIGVGQNGSKTVNHIYRKGLSGVSFAVCDTDKNALNDSPIPTKIFIGKEEQKGDIAGVREATEMSRDKIQTMLGDNTQMAIIIAGMGRNAGTAAAPVIARIAKGMGILTIGLVSTPFRFEGSVRGIPALKGLEDMVQEVDSLFIIDNGSLRQIYLVGSVIGIYEKSAEALSDVAKSIAEIITCQGFTRINFNDIKSVLKDSGIAIIGYGEDEDLRAAINKALESPFLYDNRLCKATKALLHISITGQNRAAIPTMEEMDCINEFKDLLEEDCHFWWNLSINPQQDKPLKATILATRFEFKDVYLDLSTVPER